MNWKDHISRNTFSAADAVKDVKSGDRVVIGHAAGASDTLIHAMVARAPQLRNVEVSHMVALNDCPYCRPEYEQSFRFNGLYISGPTREAVAEGRGDFTPIFFSQIPRLMGDASFPIDAFLLAVSPPDEQGRVSLGVSFDYALQAIRSAKMTIVTVTPHMPYVYGGQALVDVRDIARFVFADEPLHELLPPKIGPIEQAIGANIAALVPDGACLQLGIGAIPDAVLNMLGDKKDLGVHSEMVSDGAMVLVEKGVINGARKTLHPGKIVITFAMGSAAFYKWLDHNPMVEGYPVEYVNDPRVAGQNDNLISINSALSVDLLGQIAADALGTKQFSAVGGQLDFVRAARFSKGGFNVIALPSTAMKGKVSRICATFDPGQAVTTTRYDVDYVVTEHGAAYLWGKTNAKRAEALISIAAPEFREQLAREARDIYKLRVNV
jgi:4-hydroxybutyrate CoA-transferase